MRFDRPSILNFESWLRQQQLECSTNAKLVEQTPTDGIAKGVSLYLAPAKSVEKPGNKGIKYSLPFVHVHIDFPE